MNRERAVWKTALVLLLVGFNLRLTIAALPPVLGEIQATTGISSAASGLLTAIPALCFGFASLAVPALLRRMPMAPAVGLALGVIALGSALRLDPTIVALFAGTAILSSGIAVANVLVPSLIKLDFPGREPLLIGLYSVTLNLGAALAAALTTPIENWVGGDWRPAVALWGVFAIVALLFWIPRMREAEPGPGRAAEPVPVGRALWRDRVAWNVTIFFGLQSLAFYAMLSWMPRLLEESGLSQGEAGWMLAFAMFPSMVGALGAPLLGRHLGRAALLVLATSLALGGGYAGLILAPASATYPAVTLVGLGQGASLALALGFVVARSPDSHHAAHLSAMAQGVGYLIAASGPFALGALRDLSDGWTAPMLLLLLNLVPLTLSGLASDRDRFVLAPEAVALKK